jgi:hypothetical protein
MTNLSTRISTMLNLSDAEIVSELNALTVRQIDSQRWTWAGLALRFGSETVGQIDEMLKESAGYDWVRLLLAGGGIDFSTEQTQDALESLRSVLGTMTDSLKGVGIWYVSPWADAGRDGLASIDDVALIRSQLLVAANREALESKWATVCNEIVNPAIASGSTWAAIKAAIAEVE